MKIHILWCTIRPTQFKNMHKIWMDRCANKDIVNTYVAVNWQEHKNELSEYNNVIVVNTDRIGVCLPSYELSKRVGNEFAVDGDNDIVIFASDDFSPPQNWDTYLINKLKDKGDVGLMVRDGYQLPDSSNMLHPAITIPIMTYGCLRKMNNVIYHPAYNHMFSDCELYLTLKESGMLYDDRLNDTTVFEHHHYAAGKRNADQADQAYNSKWGVDDQTWKIRKIMPFEQRIKVNIYEKES